MKDLQGFDEVRRIAETAGDVAWNADVLPDIAKGPLDDIMGPIGTAIDLYNVGHGTYDIAEGIDQDDGIQILDGIHDTIDGSTGVLGNLPGSAGAAFKAFNAGFTVGDFIAPYVYNDAAYEGERYEAPDEDGLYHARTGNETIDHGIDAVRKVSNGDYAGAAEEVAEGAIGSVPIVGDALLDWMD